VGSGLGLLVALALGAPPRPINLNLLPPAPIAQQPNLLTPRPAGPLRPAWVAPWLRQNYKPPIKWPARGGGSGVSHGFGGGHGHAGSGCHGGHR